MKELILGGMRSGKSQLAETRAHQSSLAVTYIATAVANDSEMTTRIAHHKERRPKQWSLIEEPIELASVLLREASDERCLLVDCLTLWLTNLFLTNTSNAKDQQAALLQTLPTLSGHIILVSNEVSLGGVPMNALARRFADDIGYLHQTIAAQCDRVTLVVAGIPQVLKGS